jgi:hypothetical protein
VAVVYIEYEARAASLKGVTDEIINANKQIGDSAEKAGKEGADAFKKMGASMAGAFAGEKVKKGLKDINVESLTLVKTLPKVVAEVVTKHFPDYRRILNELQRYSVTGKIDSGILVNLSQESFRELVGFLKEKKFPEVRKWVAKNSDIETTQLFKELYDNAVDFLDPSTIHHLVLILADYQYKAAFVADHELNTVAAMTEIMIQCKFK